MIKVLISKQSNYPVKSSDIKKRLSDFLIKKGVVSDADVSIAIVGEKRMLSICKKYLNEDRLHNVLSFTPDEVKKDFIYPPDGILHLGDIVVCCPLAVKEANLENMLISEKIYELIEHGAMHLLGIHHEE